MAEVLKNLGIGLSRVLRYSYGGFLLIAFASVIEPNTATRVWEVMPWQLMALTAVVVGAGLYAAHRNIVVPSHHALLCLLWWGVDRVRGIDQSRSASPTRWLGSIGVPLVFRISAYTALRQSDVFEKEKTAWDIAHAETGMVLMTAEAFFLAAVYARSQTQPMVDWQFLGWSFLVLFVFSYAGFIQHAVECMRIRRSEKEVRDTLRALGMIS